MSTFDAANYYFSGQGVVMIGSRDPVTGNPQGLRPVGNVSDLKITVATTVIDHKGSQDGQRAIDARLQTETKATASMTIDNWNSQNLAKALRGNEVNVPAGTSTSEAYEASPGLVSGFKYINITPGTLVVKQGATSLVPYSVPLTPWDYKENDAAGSIILNDGTEDGGFSAFVASGTSLVLTAVATTIGDEAVYTGTITGGGSNAFAGLVFQIAGFVGVNNNGSYKCVGSSATTLVLSNLGATAETHAGTAINVSGVYNLTATYNYSAQYLTNSLTQPLTDNWVRFEGLNTLESNSPVVVDIFRFSNDPLKELALISDTFGQFVLEGAVLKDFTRANTGVNLNSAYFTVKKIDS